MAPKPDEKSKIARDGYWQVKFPREYRDRMQQVLDIPPFKMSMVDAIKMAIDLLEADLKSKYPRRKK